MESSEDDAGTATNASRRETAREKDMDHKEDADTPFYDQGETSETKRSCTTPTMSEDNFDGDSVPSPSTQDVHTSTEAILDMIDEIVDGPKALKKVNVDTGGDRGLPSDPVPGDSECVDVSLNRSDNLSVLESVPELSGNVPESVQLETHSESSQVNTENLSIEPHLEETALTSSTIKVESAPISGTSNDDSSGLVLKEDLSVLGSEATSSLVHEESASILEANIPVECAVPDIPCSSNSSNVDSIGNSELQTLNRTVKCESSSVVNDSKTVESVESTTCEAAVSTEVNELSQSQCHVQTTRPDTTVSSTVDIPSNITHQTETITSECVTKDVSSSSDAVSPSSANDAEDVTQNNSVSELNVTSAETGVSSLETLVTSPKLCSKNNDTESESCEINNEGIIEQCQSSVNLSINVDQTSDSSVTTCNDIENDSNLVSISKPETSNKDISPSPRTHSPLVLEQVNKSPQRELNDVSPTSNTISNCIDESEHRKVPPIKLSLSCTSVPIERVPHVQCNINDVDENVDAVKVPKLTIKLGNKPNEEMKSPVPKLTIKPLKPPPVTEESENSDPFSNITKLNIRPLIKPAEKINDIHRKSSSSEISESESSENDESSSTSDQASVSDQSKNEVVPKVTIKLGKPGTESEGKFYTEKNTPKSSILNIQNEQKDEEEVTSKIKLKLNQSDDRQYEKVPKLTIKPISKSEGQPLSPKLTIKPIKPPDNLNKDVSGLSDIPKLKIVQESLSPKEARENSHVPKITIKPVMKSDSEISSKSVKKTSMKNDESEHIPVVTKINIRPIPKPTDNAGESSECSEDNVRLSLKLNRKPIGKPKDSEIDSSIEEVPKLPKLNKKPIKNPEANLSDAKDCDVWNTGSDENIIPVVTKVNIKPIFKPIDHETLKDSENQSSETGNSSDDNTDQIPVVTKLNIRPVLKPTELDTSASQKQNTLSDDTIPVVTKINIKPLINPDENMSSLSPKKESSKTYTDKHTDYIPLVTKVNIKPIVKPDDARQKPSEEVTKNPPLVMKINIKPVADTTETLKNVKLNNKDEHKECNNVEEIPVVTKINIKPLVKPSFEQGIKEEQKKTETTCQLNTCESLDTDSKITQNCSSEIIQTEEPMQDTKIQAVCVDQQEKESPSLKLDHNTEVKNCTSTPERLEITEATKPNHCQLTATITDISIDSGKKPHQSSTSSCTLLKKLLEDNSFKIADDQTLKSTESSLVNSTVPLNSESKCLANSNEIEEIITMNADRNCANQNDLSARAQIQDPESPTTNEHVSKPLEIITASDKISSSGQESPRIILKINKTDYGTSSEIITEDMRHIDQPQISPSLDNVPNDKQYKSLINSRKKMVMDETNNMSLGKRLRSSRVVQESEKSAIIKKTLGKKLPHDDTPDENRDEEMTNLESKRLKLGKLLLNKSLSIVPKVVSAQSTVTANVEIKTSDSIIQNTIFNNENCSKNGNSKLHKILSNLQAKQLQPHCDVNNIENEESVLPEKDSTNTSTGSSDVSEVIRTVNSHPTVQEMMLINESSVSRDFSLATDETAQDPLEMDTSKLNMTSNSIDIPQLITPQPKKRGRPRKLPVSEGAKPITLPKPALEERPQRSLRLNRDRPIILAKPRGRGRGGGRGAKRLADAINQPEPELHNDTGSKLFNEDKKVEEEIDPTSSRIKLPRMTEALDKMPSTPLTSRRRNSSMSSDTKQEHQELQVSLDIMPKLEEELRSPEFVKGRGRGARSRGRTPARSPRYRGRGRGGGRGAVYMKETLGIYGRVCGPATTTVVEIFEEETCMMDDNATPAKPTHLLDEDSQSSVKSSTNESSKMKKSKFADLFDSNKVWTAADVKEYTWPPEESDDVQQQVMMIQEQVAMFLSVKSFKRRYPELKRRAIVGDEKNYLLSKGIVTEALCDLGITAVDASEVLDIMLSDYPHKYEEYRSHQRERQMAEASAATQEPPAVDEKSQEKLEKIEIKVESKPVEQTKPEPPKIDPEKLRQEMAAAAIASASEWNMRANALRRTAVADLQTLTVHRRRVQRAPAPAPRHPPAGLYPHALLPGQYQHSCRVYTPQQLRYFPLNTVLATPPAPPSPADSGSDSEPDWSAPSSSDHSDNERSNAAKRKKLSKSKRASGGGVTPGGAAGATGASSDGEPETCRTCGLREEANRKYSHERFLACAHCRAKLHPSCLELGPDTIRKCREYAWQCAECKSCNGCHQPKDDDKMLFCDLCDRGFHIYCVGLDKVPSGRWHCVECAVCRSCGSRDAGGPPAADSGGAPPDWHHQTRRGPGGHKLYSHSLCTPCARAYRIGRYCPLCERSFIGPKGTMQLVICKLCDRQLHQECVKQTVSNLNVLDYTCNECRKGGITSRAAAVRLAPRTIATLFMAKRRFNKYAHRQYLQSLKKDDPVDEPPDDPPKDSTDSIPDYQQ